MWETIDTAPKDKAVLLSDGEYVEFGYHESGLWMVVNNGDYTDGGYGRDYEAGTPKGLYAPRYARPTHWMPLPPPPVAMGGKEE